MIVHHHEVRDRHKHSTATTATTITTAPHNCTQQHNMTLRIVWQSCHIQRRTYDRCDVSAHVMCVAACCVSAGRDLSLWRQISRTLRHAVRNKMVWLACIVLMAIMATVTIAMRVANGEDMACASDGYNRMGCWMGCTKAMC